MRLPKFLEKDSIKERIFIYYFALASFLSALQIVINIINGLDFLFNYKWIGFSAVSLLLLCLEKNFHNKKIIHRTGVYLLTLVAHPFFWLISTGLQSPSIVYTFVILIMINYLLDGVERIILNFFHILITLTLIAIHFIRPEIYKPITHSEQFLDWMINVPVLFSFIILLLIAFERAYEKERLKNEQNTLLHKQKSQTDPLTGLYNRNHLSETWSQILNTPQRRNESISLIIFDIDFFKNYNDHYGHTQGDWCLEVFSRILARNATRAQDYAYRIGGEEFLIILGETRETGAISVAKKISSDLAEMVIPHKASPIDSKVTFSAGITTITPTDAQKNITVYIEEADKALYESKRTGRNRITCYSDLNFGYHPQDLTI